MLLYHRYSYYPMNLYPNIYICLKECFLKTLLYWTPYPSINQPLCEAKSTLTQNNLKNTNKYISFTAQKKLFLTFTQFELSHNEKPPLKLWICHHLSKMKLQRRLVSLSCAQSSSGNVEIQSQKQRRAFQYQMRL